MVRFGHNLSTIAHTAAVFDPLPMFGMLETRFIW